jgi:CheY-like chemotaxis protein
MTRGRVLVIDDDASIRHVLREALAEEGWGDFLDSIESVTGS